MMNISEFIKRLPIESPLTEEQVDELIKYCKIEPKEVETSDLFDILLEYSSKGVNFHYLKEVIFIAL
ncbi:MAG: hypothetical protein ACTSUK_06835, partial [Promethearchaeota archaeon]